jgi:thioredoxin 1
MTTEELTKSSFENFKKNKLALVDFFAEWCMPCLMLAPVIEELSEKMKKIKFGKVNIDESQDLAEEFSVMSVPTLIILKDGKEVDRIIGTLPADVLEEKIKKHL